MVVAMLEWLAPAGFAQGCVAVRGAGMLQHPAEGSAAATTNLAGGDWVASVANRYLHSSRHFVGDVEQKQRQLAGNQIINSQDFIDVGLQYAITPRWSVGLTLPFSFSERSQLAPANYNRIRYHTESGGVGDARLTGYVWLWDPRRRPKGNIQLGLGLKAPSGDDGVSDTFLTANGPVNHPVDQSIQLGDGGWGVSLELNAYREILPRTELFLQAFYLANPRNVNDTLTWRDNSGTTPGAVTATPDNASYYEHFMSVPDQYFTRGGLGYRLIPQWGLSLNLAGRLEGVPVRDLFGGSDGFRRPGFIVSIEPGLEIMKGRYTFNVSLPLAVYRNRERSVADQRAAAVKGSDVHGDAAFADYVTTASFSVRF